ncbi:MAG: GNAT family N-acetyltransferase [Chloroflexota bacterium]|nr:GNAT family N-acetyltransferase [Chloroflexota bacterium]
MQWTIRTRGEHLAPPETFTTHRLHLRPPQLDDADALFHGYIQDPDVTRYLVWRPHMTITMTRAFTEGCLQGWHNQTEWTYILTDRTNHAVLGMLSLRSTGFTASLGYVLMRAAWGQGLIPEAAVAVVSWVLGQPDIFRVWAVCDVDNRASARVLEKIGMQREGLMRRGVLHPNISDEPRDCWLYAKVK